MITVNGIEIADVTVNGSQDVQKVTANGTVVWERYDGPPSPVIITSSGTYVAGTDFPANKDITVECLGGGGSGGYAQFSNGGAGGYASNLVTDTISISNGTTVSATIGGGGSSGGGGTSTFDSVSSPGAGKGSDGGCGFGNGCAGENSVWGSGGAGGVGFGAPGSGGVGAGGGGTAGGNAAPPGSGGRGEIRLSWS